MVRVGVVAATVGAMSRTFDPGETAALVIEMTRRGIDPTLRMEDALEELRSAGVPGSVMLMRHAFRLYRAGRGVGPVEVDPRVTVGRGEAARRLGVSVKRVDQLRRRGDLDARYDVTGHVGIVEASIARRLADPRLKHRG